MLTGVQLPDLYGPRHTNMLPREENAIVVNLESLIPGLQLPRDRGVVEGSNEVIMDVD